jgi:hypothetical protein
MRCAAECRFDPQPTHQTQAIGPSLFFRPHGSKAAQVCSGQDAEKEGDYVIAGLGFARMAWELAKHRYPLRFNLSPDAPGCREFAAATPGAATWEFYRITDNAWSIWLDGHQPITRIVL